MLKLDRFKAILFDFDGVIVDSEVMQARAWTRVARELGLHARQITAEEIAGRIDGELAPVLFPGHDPQWCAERKWRFEEEMEAAGELRLVDGVEGFIERHRRTHVLAVCSSCQSQQLLRRLERVGLRSAFRVVVGRTDGVAHKPAPDLYLRALAELGISSNDACAIEDSPTGVAAAKAAGLHVIQLVHAGMPRSSDADEWISGYPTPDDD